MKTITFKELIELLEQGKAPNKIIYDKVVYEWGILSYRDDNNISFNERYTLARLVGAEIQIPEESLLTDEEKAYLKAVIEPVKEDVFSIRRQSGTLYIHISVTATMTFNLKTFIYKFSGLKDQKSYTLKDLDLE